MAQLSRKAKIITILSLLIAIVLTLFIYFHFFFVYSSGVNAGNINYMQCEGIIFKTLCHRQEDSRYTDALLRERG